MSHKSDKALDRLMQEKLLGFKAEPPAGLWNRISGELDKPAKKRLPYAWLSAAAVLIFAAFGLWLINPSTIEKKQIAIQTTVPQPEPTVLRDEAPERVNPLVVQRATVRVGKSKVASPKGEINRGTMEQALANTQPAVQAISVETVANPSDATVLAEPFPISSDAAPAQLQAAIVVDESEKLEQDEPVQRLRGGSIGRFVNKLLAKVDSREDKLIEVSEEAGEGLRITGLNLGLVKMKNKYSK